MPLNPNDNQGVRFCWEDVRKGGTCPALTHGLALEPLARVQAAAEGGEAVRGRPRPAPCVASRFVARSAVLKELVVDVQLSRGRVYFWRGEGGSAKNPAERTRAGDGPEGGDWGSHS
jgi:hypothetical protein